MRNIYRACALSYLLLLCFSGCTSAPPEKQDPYQASLELITNQQYREAINNLQLLLAQSPDDWYIYHYLGICYEKTGRRYKAVDCYQKAISLTDTYRPYYRLGILYIEMGQADKALPLLREVKRYNPDFLSGRFYLAIAAFFNNKIDEAFEHFQFILEREDNNPNSLAGIGMIRYYQGNPFQAIEFLVRSIRYAPEWSWGRFQLGQIYLRMGRLHDARREFEQALRFDPENVEARYHLALVLDSLGKKDAAGTIFTELLEQNDDDGDRALIRASILIKQGDYTAAGKLLREALRDGRRQFEIYKRLGYIYAVTGDKTQGRACYREALKHQPDDIGVRYNYAVLLKQAGMLDRAEEEMDEILAISPLASEGYFLQGIIYGNRGNLKKAEELIKTAVELDRFNQQGREILLNILISSKKLTEAALIAEEVLQANPDNRPIKGLLARVFLSMEHFGQAEALLLELINLDQPGHADIEYIKLLHTVYEQTSRHREARELEERLRALGIDPFEKPVRIY